MQGILLLIVLLLLAGFWVMQFVQLMVLSDSDFPGRTDKILWVAAFLLIAPAAPFAFLLWKSAMTQVRGRRP
jgi:hypothetical protein